MGVAFDGTGSMYVVNKANSSITVYDPQPTGDAPAVRRIGGPSAPLTELSQPDAIGVDDIGRIYVSQHNSLVVFAPGANGNVPPAAHIFDPSLSGPVGLALR